MRILITRQEFFQINTNNNVEEVSPEEEVQDKPYCRRRFAFDRKERKGIDHACTSEEHNKRKYAARDLGYLGANPLPQDQTV